MFFLLIVVLFQGDPAQLPDPLIKAFPTQQACMDAAQNVANAVEKNPSGYAAVGVKCEAISDPHTEKGA